MNYIELQRMRKKAGWYDLANQVGGFLGRAQRGWNNVVDTAAQAGVNLNPFNPLNSFKAAKGAYNTMKKGISYVPSAARWGYRASGLKSFMQGYRHGSNGYQAPSTQPQSNVYNNDEIVF